MTVGKHTSARRVTSFKHLTVNLFWLVYSEDVYSGLFIVISKYLKTDVNVIILLLVNHCMSVCVQLSIDDSAANQGPRLDGEGSLERRSLYGLLLRCASL